MHIIVFETGGKNHYKPESTEQLITLLQSDKGYLLFTVTYGLQVKSNLTYSEACKELGQCILHNLCCKSLVSNEGK